MDYNVTTAPIAWVTVLLPAYVFIFGGVLLRSVIKGTAELRGNPPKIVSNVVLSLCGALFVGGASSVTLFNVVETHRCEASLSNGEAAEYRGEVTSAIVSGHKVRTVAFSVGGHDFKSEIDCVECNCGFRSPFGTENVPKVGESALVREFHNKVVYYHVLPKG